MMSDKAKLRRYEDDLNVSGTGIVIMGAWSIVKLIMDLFLESKEYFAFEADSKFEYAFGVTFVAIISLIVIKIHLYIGLNAIKASKGREHKKGYFAGSVIILIIMVLCLLLYIEKFQDIDNIDTTISALLVDLTTIYILAVVVISTVKIKKLRKKMLQE